MKRFSVSRAGMVGLVLTCFNSLPVISSTLAQPLYVSVSDAQYATYVEAQGSPVEMYPPISRSTTSPSPISDEIDQPITDMWPGVISTNYAIANAGLFTVSDQTGRGTANAEAVSQLWFTPLADQSQTIGIQIQARGSINEHPWTAGQITLLDLTSGSQLWNYSWEAGGSSHVPIGVPSGDNIPWDPDDQNADLDLTTQFLASHQYELTLITCSNAGDDDEATRIQLSGLQIVPEPSAIVLLAMCVLGLVLLGQYKSVLSGKSSSRFGRAPFQSVNYPCN